MQEDTGNDGQEQTKARDMSRKMKLRTRPSPHSDSQIQTTTFFLTTPIWIVSIILSWAQVVEPQKNDDMLSRGAGSLPTITITPTKTIITG